MKTPLVSIIIPTYNRLTVLKKTLQSILDQDYDNKEIIVVDDGSTDGTNEYITQLRTQNQQIVFLLRDDFNNLKGAPACRNLGLEKSSGEYILFLDSDDLLKSDCLSQRVIHFQNHSELDFLVFSGAFFTENIEDSDLLWNRFTEEDDLMRFLRGDVVWQTSGPIWKRKFLIDNNHYFDMDAKSSQDWEFHIHILLNNPIYKKIYSDPDYFVRRSIEEGNRISAGHYSSQKFSNRVPLIKKIVVKLKDYKKQKALHQYLVRDAVFCLRKDPQFEIVNLFKQTSKFFSQKITSGWTFIMYGMYYAYKYRLSIVYRILFKIIDVFCYGYFRGFKLTYKSKY